MYYSDTIDYINTKWDQYVDLVHKLFNLSVFKTQI